MLGGMEKRNHVVSLGTGCVSKEVTGCWNEARPDGEELTYPLPRNLALLQKAQRFSERNDFTKDDNMRHTL